MDRDPREPDSDCADLIRVSRRVDVADAVDLPAPCEVALDVVAPRSFEPGLPPLALCCLPGGYLTRRYYDLDAEGDSSYSFSAFMAERGFVTVALDHLGSGESSKPEDPDELSLARVADANRFAMQTVLTEIEAGSLHPKIPPQDTLASVGVGHSLGSALSVVQQARSPSHDALLLFSFSTGGFEDFLLPGEREFANRPEEAIENLPRLARARFESPYPRVGGRTTRGREEAFATGTAEKAGVRALKKCGTNLVAQPGLLTMIPGGYAPFAADIEVPVFVATGDHDLTDPLDANLCFPKAREFVAYQLDDSWHCHNVARTRHLLWERSANWIRSVVNEGTIA